MPKTDKKKIKKKEGRPLFNGKNEETVISKLRSAWDMGATDVEACLHADISTSALSRYLEKKPAFRAEKDVRKKKPILKARITIYKDLDNPATAKWYLERKCKIEFATMEKYRFDGDISKSEATLADFVRTVIDK